MKIPRGIRNHNPGNIELIGDRWDGLADDQNDGRFCIFTHPKYGIRAIMKILLKYYWKYQLKTPLQIANRWAPPHENDTGSYAFHIASMCGVDKNEEINLAERKYLIKVAKAIVNHENGKPPIGYISKEWYNDDVYVIAAEMALTTTKGEKHA